jgi:VanZ family protein
MKVLAFVVICAYCLLAWSADRGAIPYPLAQISDFPGGDLLGHFLIATAITYVVNRAFSCRTIQFKSRRYLLGSMLIFYFITIEEISQIFLPSREFSLLDLASDYLGFALAGWVLKNEQFYQTRLLLFFSRVTWW